MSATTVLTYGTFDLLHVGHLRLLQRLRALGDKLIVGVSTDEFNKQKGKKTIIPYADRAALVGSLRCVDEVFPERCWEQKRTDINRFGVGIFGMGEDWLGKFDDLSSSCRVVYLPRTLGVSTTEIKGVLRALDDSHISDMRAALDVISQIIKRLE